jgi:hypothetical protein
MRASAPSSLADILDGHLEGGVAVVPEPGPLWQVESRRSFPSGQEGNAAIKTTATPRGTVECAQKYTVKKGTPSLDYTHLNMVPVDRTYGGHIT